MKLKNYKINKEGFTLIELLVVVAIIGVLASIVLASLNTARDKGKVAAIKSNLKNMGLQMELAYSENGSYGGINAGTSEYLPSTVCIGPIANMAQSIISSGAKARCLSTNVSGWSDVNQRWGASGLIYSSSAPVRAWSASNMGVVTWDARGVNLTGAFVSTDVTMTWNDANTACGLAGGRLPTIEELKTLGDAQCEALGSADCTADSERNPPGFVASGYWSSTTLPSDSDFAYLVIFVNGWRGNSLKINTNYVHCVR